jgi:anti-anti-sigma regulatory factor
MTSSYEMRVRSHGDTVILDVSGRVGIEARSDLSDAIDVLITLDGNIDVDLSGAELVDAAAVQAIGTLVWTLQAEGREVRLERVSAETLHMIDLVGPDWLVQWAHEEIIPAY